MKIFITKLLLMMGILSCVYGCSSDESIDSRNVNLNDLIMDKNIGEEWNGTGVPSWLSNRFFNFVNEETEWLKESYWGLTQCNAYKLNYENNLLLVLNYERFGYHGNAYYNNSGTLCFTNDGRRIKFESIKDKFEGKAELIWSNELGSKEYSVKVEESGLSNAKSLGWLQEVINQICEKVKEPEQVLYRVAFGYAHSETKTYVVVEYEYFDKNNIADGEIRLHNVYTTDGKMVETSENLKIEELYEQRIKELWAEQ